MTHSPEIKNKKDDKFTWFDLIKSILYFLGENKKKFIIWNIIVFIVLFFKLVPPIFVGLIVDFFVTYTYGDSLNQFYIYCITIAILYILVTIIRITAWSKLGHIVISTQYNIKTLGFEKLMNFNLKWHDKENSGNKVQRINDGTSSIMKTIKLCYNAGFVITTTFIGILIIFIFLDINFFIFFLVYLLIFFLIEFFFNKKLSIANDKLNKATEISTGTYYESTNNIMSIKTLGAKHTLSRNVSTYEKKARDYAHEKRVIGVSKWKYFHVLNGVSLGIFLYLIGIGVISQKITIGFIFVFYTYFEKLKEGSIEGTKVITELIEHKSAIKRMMPIFLDDNDNFFGDDDFPQKWSKINLNNISFSYSVKNKLFNIDNINLNIKRNEKIGIVGKSGSGKSTLLKLFLGLYKIEKGDMKIGKSNFYDINHDEISKNISVVLQETELFNMSLKDNVTLLKDIDQKTLNLAIEISQLQPIINKLEIGINSLIGEKGYRLSGGERQRVGIARAICKNSPILIMDEATSSLDSLTEQKIQKAIEKNLDKKTMLIVAHRLSTLKNVNRIIVFDNGKIIEEGTFKSLIKQKNSKFKKIWDLQNKK